MRLARTVGILFVGLALVLCGAVMVPRVQPRHDAIPDVGRCDEILCFLGILPGKTELETAVAILKNTHNFAPSDYSPDSIVYKQSEPYYRIQFLARSYLSPNPVDEVDLSFFDKSITVGHIVLQFGPPCAVFTGLSNRGRVYLRYPGAVVSLAVEVQANVALLSTDSPATQINLFDKMRTCEQLAGKYEGDSPWHGFGKY
jgi:hypothetical protein